MDLKIITLSTFFFVSFYLINGQTTINYNSSSEDFVNPERGFYRYSETSASNYTFLDAPTMATYRNLHTPPTAGYQVYSSLVFRYFILDDFKTSSISSTFLTNMQTDFNAARTAGVKLIIRFAYTIDVNSSGCGNWICPPYGDASKSWVQTHISELASVLQANADVIAVVQMGFIGVWGEQYYTDYFGDASMSPFKLTNANWQDRIDVLDDLLDVVPVSRMVQVRYPQKKQRFIYGITAPTNSAAITPAQAHNGSDIARISFHNDCYLASADDFGTYFDYGNDNESAQSDTTNLKPYFADDSKYTVVGGETCGEYNPYNDCSASHMDAYADIETKRMHYSYLNSQYNNDVNNDWVGVCMDDIKKNMGYRFELQSGTYSDDVQPNQVISANISLKNNGFAAPFNPRGVELILRNTSSMEVWYAKLTDDPRFWLGGNSTYSINHNLCIPSAMPTGTYDLLINFPDPEPSIYARSEYAIRLANKLPNTNDVWESSTGYNDLGHQITINNTASNAACNGEITFTSTSLFLPSDLIDFSAESKLSSILLKWKTLQEIDNQGFNVQRSTDGNNFENIAWIDGQGNSTQLTNYEYDDIDAEKGILYYYRLEQVDFDGTKNYSQIITGFIEDAVGNSSPSLDRRIKIYPNPTQNYVRVKVDIQTENPIQYEILDIFGRRLLDGNINSEKAVNLDISELEKGIYYFRFFDRTRMSTKKVMVY
jgi:hypothetical protein